jgi:hypothetical protein
MVRENVKNAMVGDIPLELLAEKTNVQNVMVQEIVLFVMEKGNLNK